MKLGRNPADAVAQPASEERRLKQRPRPGETSDEPISLASKDRLKGSRRNGKVGRPGDSGDCNIAQPIDEQSIDGLGRTDRTAVSANICAEFPPIATELA
jgi:hypothetical protein